MPQEIVEIFEIKSSDGARVSAPPLPLNTKEFVYLMMGGVPWRGLSVCVSIFSGFCEVGKLLVSTPLRHHLLLVQRVMYAVKAYLTPTICLLHCKL